MSGLFKATVGSMGELKSSYLGGTSVRCKLTFAQWVGAPPLPQSFELLDTVQPTPQEFPKFLFNH